MSAVATVGSPRRVDLVWAELGKFPAFLRRDFLVAYSYRLSFFMDMVSLVAQAVMFYFVRLMVDTSRIPTFGGVRADYMSFVAVGIAVSTFLQIGLGHMGMAIRYKKLMGTLGWLLVS